MSLPGRLASAVPVVKRAKNNRLLLRETRKGAGMTENVKGNFTQRRKDRKGAKAGQMLRARLCVFAIFASLREIFPQ